MDLFYFFLLGIFLLGIILIMYSLYNPKSSIKDEEIEIDDYLSKSIETKLSAIDTSVSEADGAISELTEMSEAVFKELDSKYEELLFLYNLIDEKKNALQDKDDSDNTSDKVDMVIDDMFTKFHNSKYKNIKKLARQGLSVKEIAKELDMGQGEVMLIMELEKGRISKDE